MGKDVTADTLFQGQPPSPVVVSAMTVSRRTVLLGTGWGVVAVAAGGSLTGIARASCVPARAVLSFHCDEPWLDQSGAARPWLPPAGCLGGRTSDDLTDERLRRLNCYL